MNVRASPNPKSLLERVGEGLGIAVMGHVPVCSLWGFGTWGRRSGEECVPSNLHVGTEFSES
jgi:hypothetical protein